MQHPEDRLHISCVRYFAYAHPELALLLHHSPNGGKRNAREAARFKAMGTRAGFPDLALLVPRGNYHGAFFELKAPKGVLSAHQKAYIEALREQGYYVAIIRSIDDFINESEGYLNGLKNILP